MKIAILGLLSLFSATLFTRNAYAAQQFIRLDSSTIESISSPSELSCIYGEIANTIDSSVYGVYTVSNNLYVMTSDGQKLIFVDSKTAPWSSRVNYCEFLKKENANFNSDNLRNLNSIKKNTMILSDSGICGKAYMDVVINDAGEVLNKAVSLTPTNCPKLASLSSGKKKSSN